MPKTSPIPGVLLLCVDMQSALLKVIPDGDEVKRRCAFALEAAAGLGISVVFTEQSPTKLGATDKELLALAPDAVRHPKIAFSAFSDEKIAEALQEQDLDHLIICGLETPVCVYQTALGALDANIQVTVLTDAIGARRGSDAGACLNALNKSGVHLLPSETVFYALLHDAGHPFFKSFTQLVKKYG